MTTLKMSVMVTLALAVLPGRGADDKKAPPGPREVTAAQALEAVEWTLSTVNRKNTIDVTDSSMTPPGADGKRAGPTTMRLIMTKDGTTTTGFHVSNLPVSPQAKITLDGKPARWDDLKGGQRITLRLDKKAPTVTEITATSKKEGKAAPPWIWKVQAVDAARRLVTLASDEAGLVVKNAPVAEDARLSTTGLTKEGGLILPSFKLADLEAGTTVAVEFRIVEGTLTVSALTKGK
jgi:hypothetical protein